jgi:hypothetical protein
MILNNTTALYGQTVVEDPIVVINTDWSNHKIENFHSTPHGLFVFIDDGSIWRVNSNDAEWVIHDQDQLLGVAITFMPETGTEAYPVKIIVHNDYCWKDFTVSQETAPTLPGRAHIADVIEIDNDLFVLKIQKRTKEGPIESTLFINPQDYDTVKNWKTDQRIVICGVWFPEYDPIGRKEYNCTFLFTIYNYNTKEFAFFTF